MVLRVRTLVERAQVVEDLVLAAVHRAVRRGQDRDLVRPGDALELVALVRRGGNLARDEVEAELGETLPDGVGVRTPFRLEELHVRPLARCPQDETALRSRDAPPAARRWPGRGRHAGVERCEAHRHLRHPHAPRLRRAARVPASRSRGRAGRTTGPPSLPMGASSPTSSAARGERACNLRLMRSNGADQHTIVSVPPWRADDPVWAPGGRSIAFNLCGIHRCTRLDLRRRDAQAQARSRSDDRGIRAGRSAPADLRHREGPPRLRAGLFVTDLRGKNRRLLPGDCLNTADWQALR